MNNYEYNQRLIALEERLAWQDETIDSLDKTVSKLNEMLHLQQEQLRWLYTHLSTPQASGDMPANEKPPHY
ncbi:MAG: SlyX family protein [Neisseriaceae bacterium]|nr:SlyX family protein [Neisseriaceae bacterium]